MGDVRRPGKRRLLHHLLVQPGVSGVGEQTAWARFRVRWRNQRPQSAIRIADPRRPARHATATLRPGERRGDASHVPLGPHGAEPAGERACERDLRRWAESGAIGVGCSGHPVVIGATRPMRAKRTTVGCIGPVRRGIRSRPATTRGGAEPSEAPRRDAQAARHEVSGAQEFPCSIRYSDPIIPYPCGARNRARKSSRVNLVKHHQSLACPVLAIH